MEEDIQKKTYEEIAALKDLFLRRLMDDKIKAAALVQLKMIICFCLRNCKMQKMR